MRPEFSKRLKRTNNFVWCIEARERRVDVLMFIEIAKAANLDPLELMGRVLKRVGLMYPRVQVGQSLPFAQLLYF